MTAVEQETKNLRLLGRSDLAGNGNVGEGLALQPGGIIHASDRISGGIYCLEPGV